MIKQKKIAFFGQWSYILTNVKTVETHIKSKSKQKNTKIPDLLKQGNVNLV